MGTTQHGKLYVIGLGPGDGSQLTFRARDAIAESDVIVGYKTYVDLIRHLIDGKELLESGMRHETERAKVAADLAAEGRVVAIISSGDSGVYGMAGPIFEVLHERGWAPHGDFDVEVVPGVPALAAAASLLGAPLMHDFAAISLSDLLTPWETIQRRLEAAAQADFVICLYNPRSHKRVDQLAEAGRIIGQHRAASTPVGIVRAAYREEQSVVVTDLEHLLDQEVDMLTTVVVGNSTSFQFNERIVTPRGYASKYDLASEARPSAHGAHATRN